MCVCVSSAPSCRATTFEQNDSNETSNNTRDASRREQLKGYPTWIIGGYKVEGDRDVAELEEICTRVEKGETPEED